MTMADKANNAIRDAKLILDRSSEKKIVKAARALEEQIQSGALEQLRQIELVNTYMELAGENMSDKEKIRNRVRLIKMPKRKLIEMLDVVAKNITANG